MWAGRHVHSTTAGGGWSRRDRYGVTVAERTLCIVVCGARPAADVVTLIVLAQAEEWDAFVVATPSALPFLDSDAVERLTGQPIRSTHRPPGESRANSAGNSTAMIVAPATFNVVNKVAAGIGDE